MAEIMEREELAPDTAETAPKAAEKPKGGKWKNMPRKKRRRIIRWCVILVVLALIGALLLKLFGGKQEAEKQVVTDYVQYGAITATVEGSGIVKAKSSESISISTPGTVLEVLVTEGEQGVVGVLVVADGAQELSVRTELMRAAMTALDVPADAVEVFARQGEEAGK